MDSRPALPLISPAAIAAGALFVNAILGSALLLWNALCLRQWGLALLALVWGALCAGLAKTGFEPNLYWLLAHFFSAACVIALSRGHREGYYGHLYDGGGHLPAGLVISLLCALQLLYLGSFNDKPPPTPPSPRTAAVSSTPTPVATSPVHKEGQLTVEYKGVDLPLVQFVTKVLVENGVCDPRQPGQAAVWGGPESLRVIAVLPPGISQITPEVEAVLQQVLSQLTTSQNPPRPVQLQLYFNDRRPAGSYQLSQP